MDTKIEKFTTKMLERMFKQVGLKYTKEATSSQEWYLAHTWTPENEEIFRQYFITEGRKDLKWNKKYAEKQAGMFILSYGWKCQTSDVYAVAGNGETPVAYGASVVAAWDAAEACLGSTPKQLQKLGYKLLTGTWQINK